MLARKIYIRDDREMIAQVFHHPGELFDGESFIRKNIIDS